MFRKYWQHRRDRRGDYSFKKHLARLKREGRLPQIGLGTLAVVLVAAVTFGRCESNITGPSETVAQSPNSPQASTLFDVRERTVQRDFVFQGENPCNGDSYIVRGTRRTFFRNWAGVNEHGQYFNITSVDEDHLKGFAVSDSKQKYEQRDKHEFNFRDKLLYDPPKLDWHRHSEEHIKAIGDDPDFTMYLHERLKITPLDLSDMKAEYISKAKCDGRCVQPGGCVEQDFITISVTETDVPSVPSTLP
jgi:hypothetical protein